MESETLFKFIEDAVFYGNDAPYARLKEEINRIDNDYFDDIQRDCEVLPAELCPGLRDKVIADFNRKISALLTDSLCDDIARQVSSRALAAANAGDFAKLAGKLRTLGRSLQDCAVDLSAFDGEIQSAYEDAKERTLSERIMQSNREDVIRFHHALQDNTVQHARRLVEIGMGEFILKLAGKISPANTF